MQKLQLSIPEPCHENWQQMTPTEQGRFCNACAKEVIDFSMMTDMEVLNYFTRITHEKVCGRALPSQLERTIVMPLEPKKRLFWYWNYIVMFFMFFGKGNAAKAQGDIKPVTEINPVKPNDVRGDIVAVSVAKQEDSRVVTGKITDENGNPVSFASIKIKGTYNGVVADANGAYSMRINSNAILVISGASFTDKEVHTVNQSVFNTVLNKSPAGEIVVVSSQCFGGVKRRERGKTNSVKPSVTNSKIIFEVKDDKTGFSIYNAVINIATQGENLSDKILSENNGIYKFTEIKLNDSYFVKVEAAGYEPNEFTIEAKDIKDRGKPWEILLRKKVTALAIHGTEKPIRLRGNITFSLNTDSLYVVDGTIMSYKPEINPDDIEDYSILKGPEAMAIFGEAGKNGAVVITTRKAKEIKLKEVVVNSEFGIKGRMAGGISFTNTYENSFLGDTNATLKTVLTGSIKVYPNPVQRNTGFSVALKLKQAGNYSMQVTDASGRILSLQKFNAGSKNHIEKVVSDGRWVGGIYYIRVFDSQNKLVSKSSFIFQ